jgi:hypothetical protein
MRHRRYSIRRWSATRGRQSETYLLSGYDSCHALPLSHPKNDVATPLRRCVARQLWRMLAKAGTLPSFCVMVKDIPGVCASASAVARLRWRLLAQKRA